MPPRAKHMQLLYKYKVLSYAGAKCNAESGQPITEHLEEERNLTLFCNWLFVFCFAVCAHMGWHPEGHMCRMFVSLFFPNRVLLITNLQTYEALSGRPGRSAHQRHGRYLYRPCPNTSGTLALPCSTGPSVLWHRISNRHSSCRGYGRPGTHGRSQST